MIRQYLACHPSPGRIKGRTYRIGSVPVGTIARVGGYTLRVEAWIPREHLSVKRGQVVTKRIAGSHVAQVRDLATNRIGRLSDVFLAGAEIGHSRNGRTS